MAERAYVDVGKENLNDYQNRVKISPGKLRRSGTRNSIGVDISTTRHNEYGILVYRSGEDYAGNIFALYFIRKEKTPLTRHGRYKYDPGQEIRIGPPESSDVSE